MHSAVHFDDEQITILHFVKHRRSRFLANLECVFYSKLLSSTFIYWYVACFNFCVLCFCVCISCILMSAAIANEVVCNVSWSQDGGRWVAQDLVHSMDLDYKKWSLHIAICGTTMRWCFLWKFSTEVGDVFRQKFPQLAVPNGTPHAVFQKHEVGA